MIGNVQIIKSFAGFLFNFSLLTPSFPNPARFRISKRWAFLLMKDLLSKSFVEEGVFPALRFSW